MPWGWKAAASAFHVSTLRLQLSTCHRDAAQMSPFLTIIWQLASLYGKQLRMIRTAAMF